jgi:hypothetical protein
MFTRLKRYVYAPMAALALWAVVLTLSPATANAQETSSTKDLQITNHDSTAPERVVVAPGDSLWLIIERQLGPSATPQRIAHGVERIYVLNQDTIGADPDKIFPGQKFVLPPAAERQMPEPERAASAQGATAPAKIAPRGRAAKSGPDRTFRTTVGEADARDGKAPDLAAERAHVPDEAAAAPVPAVRSLAPDNARHSPAASFVRSTRSVVSSVSSAASALVEYVAADNPYAGRRLLGWTMILVSLVICGVPLALAITRTARRFPRRRYSKSWYRSAYSGAYGGSYAAPFVTFGGPRSEAVTEKATRPAQSEEHEMRAASGNSSNGGGSLNGARRHGWIAAIARSKHQRVRRVRTRRTRGTGRPARQGTKAKPRTMNRRWNMEGRNLKKPGARHEWEISESLRRSLEQLPLVPTREDLSKLKPQVEGHLRTLALLERRRPLLENERHQARSLRGLLTSVEEMVGDERRV